MRFYIKNIYLILLIIISFSNVNEAFAKETKPNKTRTLNANIFFMEFNSIKIFKLIKKLY